jgi:hypothetical protein
MVSCLNPTRIKICSFLQLLLILILLMLFEVIQGVSFWRTHYMPTDLRWYHFSDGSTCGIEWNINFRYSRILFECLSFTVSFISPQMFHSLHQESVDSVDPCDTAVLWEILFSILEVKKRTVVSYVLKLCEKYQKISHSHRICNFKQHFIKKLSPY